MSDLRKRKSRRQGNGGTETSRNQNGFQKAGECRPSLCSSHDSVVSLFSAWNILGLAAGIYLGYCHATYMSQLHENTTYFTQIMVRALMISDGESN